VKTGKDETLEATLEETTDKKTEDDLSSIFPKVGYLCV